MAQRIMVTWDQTISADLQITRVDYSDQTPDNAHAFDHPNFMGVEDYLRTNGNETRGVFREVPPKNGQFIEGIERHDASDASARTRRPARRG